MKNLKEQSGTVILLGIIITTVILIIGTGVSVLVISEIKQSKNIDKSATAYYLAEYGVEDGLYEIRKRGKNINSINKDDVHAANGLWSRTGSDKRDEFVVGSLSNGEHRTIDLYDFDAVDGEGVIDYHADIEAFTIECESATTSKVEVVVSQFDPNNMVFLDFDDINDDIDNVKLHTCKNLTDPDPYSKHSHTSIQAKHAVKIKITASIGNVRNLIFKAYTDNNCSTTTQAQIADKQIIRASGTYSQTKAGLQAEMELDPPW